MNWYQQGDVMIKPIGHWPVLAKELPGAVLAEGEATGHRHVAVGEGVVVSQDRGKRYLNAPNGAEVIHPEHATLRIAPGIYCIEQVREYDHFAEQMEIEREETLAKRRSSLLSKPTQHPESPRRRSESLLPRRSGRPVRD